MSDLFLGWDVGAWNCDRNRESRDALCGLEIGESGPVIVGRPWRGNVRDLLVAHEGSALVDALLQRLGITGDEARPLTIAIDTPLGWPKRMIELVTNGAVIEVPPEADKNPYLFRAQDLALFTKGHRPLSMVRDMIGSQSTKGIHFLRRAQLQSVATGVWGRESTVAIETYPAAAVRDVEVARLTAHLLADLIGREGQQRSDAWQADIRDAVSCALVALLHRRQPERLAAPDEGADAAEGWIWLPAAVTGATLDDVNYIHPSLGVGDGGQPEQAFGSSTERAAKFFDERGDHLGAKKAVVAEQRAKSPRQRLQRIADG